MMRIERYISVILILILFLFSHEFARSEEPSPDEIPDYEGSEAPNYENYIRFGYSFDLAPTIHLYRNHWGIGLDGRAALMIDHIFSLGAGCSLSIHTGELSRKQVQTKDILTPLSHADLGDKKILYGGLYAGYHFFTDEPVNITIGALGGVGHLGDHYSGNPGCTFYIVEPELYLYCNVSSYLRIGIGASYRFVLECNHAGIGDRDLWGFSLKIGVKAGYL